MFGKYYNALVSIIITTHNRKSLLPKAINSALAQTYSNIEIIVVDDGSTDGTAEVVNQYQSKYSNIIRYLQHKEPKGACAARNYGIREARGEFVAGLDDDDEFTPYRVEELMKIYDDKWAFVCSDFLMVKKNATKKDKGGGVISLKDALWCNIMGSQVLTKRERFIEIGGFDETLSANQDYDMWIRLLENNGRYCYRLPKALYILHTEHEGSRISTSSSKIKGVRRFYNKHKNKMTKQQQIYQLVRQYKLKNKKIGLGTLIYYYCLAFQKHIKKFKRRIVDYLFSSDRFVTSLWG